MNSSTGEIATKSGQSLVQTDKSTYSVTLNYLDTLAQRIAKQLPLLSLRRFRELQHLALMSQTL